MTINDVILSGAVLTGAVWAGVTGALAIGLFRLKKISNVAQPHVSVIIAARNEERNIGNCLSGIAAQDYPVERREIIVADDHSTDGTGAVVLDLQEKIRGLKLISAPDCPEGIAPKKNALLAAIGQSSGEVILTTDADCRPSDKWLSGMASLFSPEVNVVVGYSPLSGSGISGAIGEFDAFINGIVAAGSIGIGLPVTAAGRNFAYRRSAFEEAGGFGSTVRGASGDDDLLLQRIARLDGIVRFSDDPATFVSAPAQDSLTAWWQMKRRHLSAGRRYDPVLIALSLALYLFNVSILLIVILALAGQIEWLLPIAILICKCAVDGIALAKGGNILRVNDWWKGWLIGEIIAPVIITLLVPVSQVGRIRWKDRDLRR